MASMSASCNWLDWIGISDIFPDGIVWRRGGLTGRGKKVEMDSLLRVRRWPIGDSEGGSACGPDKAGGGGVGGGGE